MSNLTHKKILLGITGSIAAYKAAELTRMLRTKQADIKIVMTDDACEFITELTLQALSGQPINRKLLDPQSEASMSHITLAKWADLFLIAPATANIIAKLAQGIADDLLSTLYLACAAPTAIVPAMNQQMWRHPATVQNRQVLLERGHMIWGPASGEQACGDIGPGRFLDPEEIMFHIEQFFAPKCLSGLKILITAGPTREHMDPVRFISNQSSGKMGYSLAQVAAELGAEVLLISGPTYIIPPANVRLIEVESARDMYQAVFENVDNYQIFISAAAVTDFRSSSYSETKIKKNTSQELILEENPDILLEVSKLKSPPFLVGFAAETSDLVNQAREKLQRKKLDLIIANLVGLQDRGFHSDYNQVTVLTKGKQFDFPLETKYQLACKLIPFIVEAYKENRP
jgi:phosphopantothenoylcysteine decarboxylase / phosphopantothenate---cysteine ligase